MFFTHINIKISNPSKKEAIKLLKFTHINKQQLALPKRFQIIKNNRKFKQKSQRDTHKPTKHSKKQQFKQPNSIPKQNIRYPK